MNVQALMNPRVKSAGTDASVADVVLLMEKHDCGAVPILNAANKLVGIVTDRDICLALGFRPVPATGRLVGILSMDDVVLHAEDNFGETVKTLKAIYRRPVPRKEPAVRLEA